MCGMPWCAETISGSASQPVSQTAQVIVLPAVGSHLAFNLEPPAGKKAEREAHRGPLALRMTSQIVL